MYFTSAGTVRYPISRGRVLFLITLIHIFLGNVLVSHNPSVYVSVATKLPRFDFFLLFSFCYISLIFTLAHKAHLAHMAHMAYKAHMAHMAPVAHMAH